MDCDNRCVDVLMGSSEWVNDEGNEEKKGKTEARGKGGLK